MIFFLNVMVHTQLLFLCDLQIFSSQMYSFTMKFLSNVCLQIAKSRIFQRLLHESQIFIFLPRTYLNSLVFQLSWHCGTHLDQLSGLEVPNPIALYPLRALICKTVLRHTYSKKMDTYQVSTEKFEVMSTVPKGHSRQYILQVTFHVCQASLATFTSDQS